MKKKILIVEDEAIIALSYKMALQNHYEITDILDTGIDAISSIKKSFPDLILMDITLKGDMTGIEAAHQIQTMYDIPIFFLSGNTDEYTKQQALNTKQCIYMKKPIDRTELLTKVGTIL